MFFNEGTNRSKGELIMVSKYFSGKVKLKLALDRVLVVSVFYGEHDIIVANVYAPNESREKYLFLQTYTNYSVTSVNRHSYFVATLIVWLETS